MASFDVNEHFRIMEQERGSYLARILGADCLVRPLAEDWSSRRYLRVTSKDGNHHVLMESVPDHTGAYTPGHKLSDFIRIANALQNAGVHAPRIIHANETLGYVLMEDFGDTSFHDALNAGVSPLEIYTLADDVLHQVKSIDTDHLPDYYQSHVHKGRQRIVDWYVPATRRARNDDGLLDGYMQAWRDVENALPPCPVGFIHVDFHVQNLMLVAGEQGLARCGVLDFQGAMRGPSPYDLANLLEDIRRDVPEEVRTHILARYHDDPVFLDWYRVLATQFHCRILGQVLRMAILMDKPHMLKYIPRVQGYIRTALSDPRLAPLAAWFRQENIDLNASGCFDPASIAPFIRDDAF